jgi:hypothetical protein
MKGEAPGASRAGSLRRPSNSSEALIAAYRDGMGLAAVAVLYCDAGIRIVAPEPGSGALLQAAAIAARWWCRRADDAQRVAAAAMGRLRRQSAERPRADASSDTGVVSLAEMDELAFACTCVTNAAKRLNVVLYADEHIAAEAMTVIARVEEEIDRMQQAGGLKSVNASYRAYRIEASARGERVVPYGQWMRLYAENLVRQTAAALRYV